MHIIEFKIDEQKFAFNLAAVDRVICSVSITPMPHTSDFIIGMINLHGQIISVIDVRQIFKMQPKEINISDQFIICKQGMKTVALWVDHVEGIYLITNEQLSAIQTTKVNNQGIEYPLQIDDEFVVYFDFEQVLSLAKLEL